MRTCAARDAQHALVLDYLGRDQLADLQPQFALAPGGQVEEVRLLSQALLLILIGIGYAAIYYFTFRFVIRKWNLRTPGREEEGEESMSLVDQAP